MEEISRIDNHYEVVKRLLGMIEPYGDHNIDQVRLDNLEDTIDLVSYLLVDIVEVCKFKGRHEASINTMADTAIDFIECLPNYTRSIAEEQSIGEIISDQQREGADIMEILDRINAYEYIPTLSGNWQLKRKGSLGVLHKADTNEELIAHVIKTSSFV